MNNFEIIYNNLNKLEKKSINAYRSGLEFKNLSIQKVVYVNNSFKPTIIASITNKVFACELFLKSMLMINGIENNKDHLLFNLIKKLNISDELEISLKEYNFIDEILKINNAFQDWRYIYEKDETIINCGFLESLCDELESKCRDKIKRTFNLNMKESFI